MLESPDGPVLYQRVEMTDPWRCRMAGGEVVAFTTPAPAKATPNEDALALLPLGEQCAVLVVADGVGGARSGDEAACLAVQRLAETLCAPDAEAGADPGRLRSAILDGIESANRAILDMAIGAATTIAVVEITPGYMRPYHVGDSMILLTGQRGKVKLLTVSHSPVAMAVEAGLLDAEAAMHHDDRHIVTNVVGCETMRIEIGPAVRVSPRDTIVLASDGLSDNLRTEEVIELVRKGRLARAVGNVVQAARHRMVDKTSPAPHKPDDLTVVAYRPRAPRKVAAKAPPAAVD